MGENITKLAMKAETALNNLRKRATDAVTSCRAKWDSKEQDFLAKQPDGVIAVLRATGKLALPTVATIEVAEEPTPEAEPIAAQ